MASTEQQIDDAVAKRHVQNTDSALGVQSADLDMNQHKIIGLEDPTGDKDAANKEYVDDHAGGNIVGPSSAIDSAVPLFDGVTGLLVKDSTRLIEDALTDGDNIPDGHAIKIYGDANWAGGGGDVVGPGSHAANYVPQWNGTPNSKILVEGFAITAAGKALLDDVNVAAQRTTLELLSAALRNAEDTLTDGSNLPDGAAIKAYGDANWAGGGYTNLIQFVDQTAWRIIYTNAAGDVVEKVLGTDGQYLKSNGVDQVPSWDTPSGAGDVVGPGNAVDNAISLFDGTTGKLIKDSTRLIEDALTDGSNLPDGHAIKVYGDANWDTGGYTNLTQFINQTAWRLFYSNSLGDVTELGLGTSGQYLKATGVVSAPIWDTPSGAGDVVGPGSAVDNAIPLYNGTTGKLIKDSTRLIEDAMSDGDNIPDGHAIKVYGDANWAAANCINVKSYGAVGDGVTDDATAIQNALNAAYTGKRCVFVPDGTYIIGTTVTIKDGVTLGGVGWESILKAKSTLSGAVLTNHNHHPGQNQYILVSNLCFDGNKASRASGYCLYFNNLQWSRFTNVKIENAPDYGILLDGTSAFCDEISFTDCLFRYNANSGIYFHVSSANRVANCSFFSNNMSVGYSAICINGGSQNVINGCSIMSNYRHGIYLTSSYSTTVKGCVVVNNKRHGIYLGTNANDNVIDGNVCDGNSEGSSGTYSGIVLEGAVLRNTITSNRCYNGLFTSNTQQYGIIETGAADYNIIVGNSLTGNISSDLVVVGTHTKAYHNMNVAEGGGGGGYTNLTEFVDQTAWRLFYSNNLGDVVELALGTSGQYLKATGVVSAPIWDTPSGGSGYTNLTQFVDQTAWRLFYSNNLGDVVELALGTSGQYLKATGTGSAPVWDTPGGGSGSPGGSHECIQYNSSGLFGGDTDFKWTATSNILNLVNAEIQSLDSTNSNFTLDSSPLIGAWTGWTYRGANVIKVKQAQVLPTNGSSHYFVDGLQVNHYDGDITNYQSSSTQHEMHCVNIDMTGVVSSIQYKDMIGLSVRTLSRIGWTARGVSAITSETKQFGTGIASNEFHIFNPAVAEGGYEQSTSMAGLQIVMKPHRGNEDGSHVYRGLMIDNFGKRITHGIWMSSSSDSYGNGDMKYGLNMGSAIVTAAAIVMPASRTGHVGTVIEYAANDYSYYDRGSNIFQFVVGGNIKLSIDSGGIFTTSGNIETNTYGYSFKGKDSGGNMLNLAYAGTAGYCMIGAYCNYTNIGSGSSQSNPVLIRVNGVNGKQIFVGATDSGGSGYRMLRVTN